MTQASPMSETRVGSETAVPAHMPPLEYHGWHAGERWLQALAGSAAILETAGPRILRSYMTEQHRTFFPQLPFIVTGCIDAEARPWASLLCAAPGFAWSPDPRSLRIDALPPSGDPLAPALAWNAPVGLLGIELPTRRRNRLNGTVVNLDDRGFLVRVEQSFGNCPQYIQRRDYGPPDLPTKSVTVDRFAELDNEEARLLLGSCDTFFVATCAPSASSNAKPGLDVSHRGGRPGFVRVDQDGLLTIPDFPGNKYFNTLGNILVNPRAGLMVPDFDRGQLLLLTGDAWIGLDEADRQEAARIKGAERIWRMRPTAGLWLRNALPIAFAFRECSPRTIATGTWT